MVTRLIFLLLLLPVFLFSGEFTASVNRNQINFGESVTLSLTLKDSSSKGTPSIDTLKQSFTITSQQQSYSTVMRNGKVTSSTIWKLTLFPQNEGEVTIPAIRVETSEGTLTSQVITIRVVKGSGAGSDSSDTNEVSLTTEVDNRQPFKNEPVIYTVKMFSKRDLADVKMQKLNVENAIVESYSEPKINKKVIDGISVNVIEFDYLITPLKDGALKIPSIAIQGVTPMKRNSRNVSVFDDDLDPFSMFQGYNQLKPFVVMTEEVFLDVQPAVAGINPWIPAKSIKLEEIWDGSQTLQVGEPVTRGFKITAEGIKSSQLPSINDLHKGDTLFKIYADKPELVDEGSGGALKSYRIEHFTIIPQQSGTLILPEISVVWWNVIKKEKVITRIPSRTLQVLPAVEAAQKNQIASNEQDQVVPAQQIVVVQRDPILYAIIAGLSLLLIAAFVWGVFLQRKINQMSKMKKNKKEKLPDLNPT